MGKIGIIVTTWFLVMAAVSCANYDPVIMVDNVSNAQTIVLKNDSANKHPFGISIEVSGKIDGQANIYLMLKGKSYKSEIIKNHFSFTWSTDWYSDSAEIKYEPIGVKEGNVMIKYSFGTLD
jgi:hypothetical protein